MRAWPSSLRSRLTFWYAALLALPLVAFALICYFVFERALLNRTDNFIDDALKVCEQVVLIGRSVLVSAAGREKLWQRLQFALDGEPDPWFEFDRARVDARQFDAMGVTA